MRCNKIAPISFPRLGAAGVGSDAAEPVARRTLQVLHDAGLTLDASVEAPSERSLRSSEPDVLCYATGEIATFEHSVERLCAAGAALPPLRIARPVTSAGHSPGDTP